MLLPGEQLGAARQLYWAEVVGEDYFVVERLHRPGAVDCGRRSAFGSTLLAELRTGRTASNMTWTQAGPERRTSGMLRVFRKSALHHRPAGQGSSLRRGPSVHVGSARTWTPAEIAMMSKTAERT
jgi:hypothetical protein